MAGTKGRSGGRNKKVPTGVGDGVPVSPRVMSPRAEALFSWLLDKLRADEPTSPWSRVDGVLIAAIAELLESQERIASLLADSPADIKLMRLRLQYASQISRMSSYVGLCPADRRRLPQVVPTAKKKDPFADIMQRMARG